LTKENVGRAIASFQRTLISGNSPFDRFDYDGDQGAISESAKRGKKLFLIKHDVTFVIWAQIFLMSSFTI
jgi:cytochrome c peroxidase